MVSEFRNFILVKPFLKEYFPKKRVMKKNAFPFLLLFFGITYLAMGQGEVPNGNFESWPPDNNNNPEFWDSTNGVTQAIPFGAYTSVQPVEDAWEGSYAAYIRSGLFFGNVIPGALTLGNFELNLNNPEESISGGVPFPHRPNALEGYYKYETSGSDVGLVLVLFYRYNETTSRQDTIGAGTLLLPPAESYTRFVAPIFYFSESEPDTMNIILLSSAGQTFSTTSRLTVDALAFIDGDAPVVELGDDKHICPGDVVTLDSGYGEGYTTVWMNVTTGAVLGSGQTLEVSEEGHYGAVVTGATGVPGYGAVWVFLEPAPAVFAMTGGGSYTDEDGGAMVGLSGSETGVDYHLYVNGDVLVTTIPGTGEALSFGLQATGVYTVRAEDTTHGCSSHMEGEAVVTNVTSVPMLQAGATNWVFPNPANERFFVQTTRPDTKGMLFIVSLTGQMLLQQEFVTGPSGLLQGPAVSSLPAGVYLLYLSFEDAISPWAGKITIQH
jgi:hypothetical protein